MDDLVGHVLSRFDLTDTDPYTSSNEPLQVLCGEVGLAFGIEDPAARVALEVEDGRGFLAGHRRNRVRAINLTDRVVN